MCTLLPAWLCLLLGLLPLEVHAQNLTPRFNDPETSKDSSVTMATVSDITAPLKHSTTERDREMMWRFLLLKEPQSRLPDQRVLQEVRKQHSRTRRHASSSRRGHGHLMRVGCILGTCQVQNLSHRLYQLIGQSGREDSSPINPRSPHSYG